MGYISSLSRLFALGFMTIALLTGCNKSKEVPYEERPLTDILSAAEQALAEEDFEKAALEFEEVERQYPYDLRAQTALIQAAEARQKALQFDDMIDIMDKMIVAYPTHTRIDYAYYLRALGYYNQIADGRRDQSMTIAAEKALKAVIGRFPNSDYKRKALFKLDLVKDRLAEHHMNIGKYYLSQKNHHAALKRFQQIIKTYEQTIYVQEALHRCVECYLALGLPAEAHRSAMHLGHNYPNSRWYDYSYSLVKGLPLPKHTKKSWIQKKVEGSKN
jgi:outer membrane protein assembly factor BamD